MIISPDSSLLERSRRLASTTAAGTISHTARGFLSLLTNSSSDPAPVAPSDANCFTDSGLRSWTTHSCPPFWSRRTMLAPIRPSPIIPSCIVRSSEPVSRTSAPGLRERFPHGFVQFLQPAFHVLPQMHAQRAPAPLRQNREITPSLRRLHHAKCVLLPRHRQIHRVIARDLEKYARVRAALIGLSGGMQKSRPKAEHRRDFLLVPNSGSHGLQRLFVLRIHRNVGKQTKVVPGAGSPELCSQHVCKPLSAAENSRIFLVREQLDSRRAKKWRFIRQFPGRFVLARQLACLHFAGFHVRLIERIDSDEGTRHRRRHLPPEKFLPQVIEGRQGNAHNRLAGLFQRGDGCFLPGVAFALQLQIHEYAVVSVNTRLAHWLPIHWDNSFADFSR